MLKHLQEAAPGIVDSLRAMSCACLHAARALHFMPHAEVERGPSLLLLSLRKLESLGSDLYNFLRPSHLMQNLKPIQGPGSYGCWQVSCQMP